MENWNPVYGVHVLESVELLIVFLLFISSLAVVYFLQRYIGDY